ERSLKDGEGKIGDEIKKEVEEKLEELKKVVSTGSVDEVKTKADALAESAQKIGSAMYGSNQSASTGEQASEEQADSGNGDKKPEEGDVVEGTVVDEENKDQEGN